jgi:hypothetical protein
VRAAIARFARAALGKLWKLVYPPTRRKLHRLVTLVGYGFTAVAISTVWAGELGLSTTGKIGATLGALAAAAASWNTLHPKLHSAIDALPIPETDTTEAITRPNEPNKPEGPAQ